MNTLALITFLLLFCLTSAMALVFTLRQIWFSLVAKGRPAVSSFSYVTPQSWPTVTVIVAAHNEERVLRDCLDHVLALDYPQDRLRFIIVNDRSTDGTAGIIQSYAQRSPQLHAIHRPAQAPPGKPAAIGDALKLVSSEAVVFFDADYFPASALLKKLVAPFIDSQVGATMGRVVPYNADANLLTNLLDLERRSGYAVDQSVRGAMHLLPQFGGTVGAVRMAAMQAAGGWSSQTLAEDTDLTYRLFIEGWTVEYVDDGLCYEEVPENWRSRFRQIRRWACGHNQCLFRYFIPVLTTMRQPLQSRLDAALVLLFFLFPPLSLLNLGASLIYPTLYNYPPFNFAIIGALAFVMSFGNFAPYFQILVAVSRDRQPQAAAMVPFLFLSSTISMLAAFQGLLFALRAHLFDLHLPWDKTARFKRARHAVS